VCWLLADDPTPVRLKTVWIPPEVRHDLAVTTVWNRPSRIDERPQLPSTWNPGDSGEEVRP
jgi:hypothetical protein